MFFFLKNLNMPSAFAGGQGAADFGSMNNWVVGSVTLLACLLCQIFAKVSKAATGVFNW